MKGLVLLYLAVGFAVSAQPATVRFSLDSAYSVGPFPSNTATAPNAAQPTGIQVSLPSTNDSCGAQPAAACGYSGLVNQLDGFSVDPRLMVCFSDAVDVPSLARGVAIIAPDGTRIDVQRVIWDGRTNCAFAKPAHVLLQQTRYLLVATDAITRSGGAVQRAPEFTACLAGSDAYCSRLTAVLNKSSVPAAHVMGASIFTTMSVTPWLQRARLLDATLPAIGLPAGYPSYFPIDKISKLTYFPANSGVPSAQIPVQVLAGVKGVFFGIFLSPSYINTSGEAAGTITSSPATPVGFAPISFHVFLPNSAAKAPIVIYVHGSGDTQFGAPTFMASTLARAGFATVAFELLGHGFGETSTMAVTTNSGTTYEWTPGRGVAIPPGTTIGPESGCIAPGPIGIRDCVRQNAVDLFSLVHLIRQTNGLGLGLDPQRIYIVGQSLGSIIGSVALPISPDLKAAVLNGDGGSSVDIAQLSPASLPLAEGLLTSLKNPELLNVQDRKAPPQFPFNQVFNDNYVFTGQPPAANQVHHAMNIQAAFETAEWLNMLADPLSYGPYLSTHPLAGSSRKPVLFQFGIGDLEVPNPTETAAVLAADAQNSVSLLNFPLTFSVAPELATLEDPSIPGLPILPHRILSNPTIFSNGAELSLSLAEQQQAAAFFALGGSKIPDANQFLTLPFDPSDPLFFPGPLPQTLNFPPQK